MNMIIPLSAIKDLLEKYHTKPIKYMGQNFLIDASALKKVVDSAEIDKKDTILEIGPGLGVLTKELAGRAKKVIAIEKDATMMEILRETLKDYGNVEIIQGNALTATNYQLPTTNYKLVANIPYYITSPLIRKFLESKNQPETIVLMVQKEVAQRICSKPPNMSLLAVSVQFYAKAQIIFYISKGCFWPVPKVNSAIIKITPKVGGRPTSTDLFFKIVKAGFSQPRKQLAGNLAKGLQKSKKEIETWLLKNNLQPKQRAETLSIEDWIDLTNTFDVIK